MDPKTSIHWLTVREAAAILKVSERTVRRWCRAGQLDAKKFGRTWRIYPEAVS